MKRPSYRLTRAADSALDEIYQRGIREFGLKQAQDYLLGLHDVFEMLAIHPHAGRAFHEFFRHEHGSHIVFYVVEDRQVIIVDMVRAGRDLAQWLKDR